jgi:sec-independent protein translocase protein TatA
MVFLTVKPQLLLSMPGGSEWIWILLVVILLFGARKIPDLARGIGKGMKEFKDAKEGKDDKKEDEKKES